MHKSNNKSHTAEDLSKQSKEKEEPRLLELFDYEKISGHLFARAVWAIFLRLAFLFYVRLKIKGSFKGFYKTYPRLIIISNHTSHLDGPAILSAIPFSHWMDLYILAAQDYWFSNGLLRFFSRHFLNAIPVARKSHTKDDNTFASPTTGGSFKHCLNLLNSLKRVWMIMFPEGTRSPNGVLRPFKKGLGLLSQKTNTPVLFLYFRGSRNLWPREKMFPRPGKICLYIGPVQKPADIDTIFNSYKKWVNQLGFDVKSKDND